MELVEIRNWLQLAVFVAGGSIALRTYIVSQRQRKLENSLKLLEIFNSNLEKGDIEEWKSVFMGSSEPAGAKPGHFHSNRGQEETFNELFSEGPSDNGAVARIVGQIDLISYQALRGTVDVQFVYSQIGQLIDTTYKWFGEQEDSLIASHYPYFNKLRKRFHKRFSKWPYKIISHCE